MRNFLIKLIMVFIMATILAFVGWFFYALIIGFIAIIAPDIYAGINVWTVAGSIWGICFVVALIGRYDKDKARTQEQETEPEEEN